MQVLNTQKWGGVVVVTLGMFMAMLDNSIVSVILPQMQTVFHTDVETIAWVVTAYFLAQAAVIPIVGYLSDRFGSKQVFLTTLAVFTISSLLCALSTTIEELIAFRVLQGLGGGALLPVGFAIVYRTFPPNQRASITSIVSIPIIMAPSFGPTLGGYLGTNFNWNAVFTINVPLGIVALFMGFLYLQQDKSGETGVRQRHFDVLGLLLSIVGFTALVYGISEASSKGWSDPVVLTSLLIGVAVLVVFAIVELKVPDPVMDLRLFMNYTFSIANILTWVVMGMLYGGLFLLPLFFQSVQGETALTSGLYMIGQGIAVGVGLAVSGALYNRVGPRVLVVSGMVLMAVGTYGLTQIDVNTTGESLQLWLIARGLGIGFSTQSLQVLALSVVNNRAMAKASSLYSVVRQVAGAVGLAALTTYLTQQITTHATDIGSALQIGLQTHNLTGVAATCAQAAGGANACVIQHAKAAGLADVFWVIMILYGAFALLGLVVGRDPAIEAQRQAQKAKVTQAPSEVAQVMSIPNVISTLTTNGEEIMGPETLLWRYSGNDVVNGSLLTIENNQFCIVKVRGAIHKVYEAGQHRIQTLDDSLSGSVQLGFNGEPIPLEHEVFYINRAKLAIKASGFALSHETAGVDYSVDYSIHVATREDAIRIVQHIPYRGHPLGSIGSRIGAVEAGFAPVRIPTVSDQGLHIRDINTYVEPVIERTVTQLAQVTPPEPVGARIGAVEAGLAPDQGLQTQNLQQLLHERLQQFLSTYGITVDEVKVHLAPRDEHVKAPPAPKAFGVTEFDAVHNHTATTKDSTERRLDEQKEELEQHLYMLWQNKLSRYTNEIVALQAELESTCTDFGQRMNAYHMRLQELSRAISSEMGANTLDQNNHRTDPQTSALPEPRISSGTTGQFIAILSPIGQGLDS